MHKGRVEAFSDGVIAIIITIMVLEMKIPHGTDWPSLQPLVHVFLGYTLTFVFVGIYWSNHHHLFQAVQHVDGRVLWANLHLLFWLSLTAFLTNWMGETGFAPLPVAIYGAVLMLAGVAYYILERILISLHGKESRIARALGSDFKAKASIALYAIGIPSAFINRWIACSIYVIVAILWLIPDRRIERALNELHT